METPFQSVGFINLDTIAQSFKLSICPPLDYSNTLEELLAHHNVESTDVFSFANSMISTKKTLDYLKPLFPLKIRLLPEKLTKPYRQSRQKSMKIFIKSLSGKITELECHPQDSIETIKYDLQDEQGTWANMMRIVFNSKQYIEGSLEQAGISPGSTVNLLLDMRGGGSLPYPTVDFTDTKKGTVFSFCSDGPEWTRCCTGLNLEGKCTNDKCKAFGEEVVVMKRLGTYDPALDSQSNECPMCWKKVEADVIAFSRCCYKYIGVALEEGKLPRKRESVGYIRVEEDYLRFDPEEAGVINWNSLKIVTVKLNDKCARPNVCAICCECTEEELKQSGCGHRCHLSCVGILMAALKMENKDMSCPCCVWR